MDSGKIHDDGADIFEPAGAAAGPVPPVEHIETETNVFSVDALRRTAALKGGTDTGSFEVSAPAGAAENAPSTIHGADADDFEPPAASERPVVIDAAKDTLDDGPDGLDDLDDDFPPPKVGFFAKLFGRGARNDEAEDDLDDLSLDDDMFIAPPPASERTAAPAVEQPEAVVITTVPEVTDSGVFEFKPQVVDEPVSTEDDEPEIVVVATVPEVTDSGVFEFKPPVADEPVSTEDVDEPVSTGDDEPEIIVAVTVPEVTDSGVFEFKPPVADEPVSTEDVGEPVSTVDEEPEVVVITTVPEVTDSGVFEFKPPIVDEPVSTAIVDEPVSTGDDEPEIIVAVTAPEATDSGVFEIAPPAADAPEIIVAVTAPGVTDSGVFEPSPPVVDEPEIVAAVIPEVTDSGVFELSQPPAAPDARKGDEWEIGWEPEDEKTEDEFDVSGAASAPAAAAVAAAVETPPPVFAKIAHICLYVENLGRAVDFYSKLGFRKRFVFNRNGTLFGAYLEFGDGNFIELFEDVSRGASASQGKLAHFCLETPDIDAAMEALSARGVGFSPKKLGCDSTYQIWLKDPDGNEFEIHQYTENSSQLVGGEVEADW